MITEGWWGYEYADGIFLWQSQYFITHVQSMFVLCKITPVGILLWKPIHLRCNCTVKHWHMKVIVFLDDWWYTRNLVVRVVSLWKIQVTILYSYQTACLWFLPKIKCCSKFHREICSEITACLPPILFGNWNYCLYVPQIASQCISCVIYIAHILLLCCAWCCIVILQWIWMSNPVPLFKGISFEIFNICFNSSVVMLIYLCIKVFCLFNVAKPLAKHS